MHQQPPWSSLKLWDEIQLNLLFGERKERVVSDCRLEDVKKPGHS